MLARLERSSDHALAITLVLVLLLVILLDVLWPSPQKLDADSLPLSGIAIDGPSIHTTIDNDFRLYRFSVDGLSIDLRKNRDGGQVEVLTTCSGNKSKMGALGRGSADSIPVSCNGRSLILSAIRDDA